MIIMRALFRNQTQEHWLKPVKETGTCCGMGKKNEFGERHRWNGVKAKMKAKTVSEGPLFCATHHVVKLAKMV